MKPQKILDISFPSWIVGVCGNDKDFIEARRLLTEEYGFIPSPIENGRKDQALVLPIPHINLDHIYRAKEIGAKELFNRPDYDNLFGGWGIGRARVGRGYDVDMDSFDFRYFLDSCPLEYIQTNPFKEPIRRLIELLKPYKLIGPDGFEIDSSIL